VPPLTTKRQIAASLSNRQTGVKYMSLFTIPKKSKARSILHMRTLFKSIAKITGRSQEQELQKLIMGRLMSDHVKSKQYIKSLREVEFKVFSQWGDDGIIQWLINSLDFPNKTFIEFGVGDYRESNTRFLMMNDNWSGLVMDSSEENIEKITDSEYFWRHELLAKPALIDCENINGLIDECNFEQEVGILHIDLDGNDYWIWKEINVIYPVLAILEYNSVFGVEKAITIPYDKTFNRTAANCSNLYFGASLPALHQLSCQKGYAFIGCNSAGNNAYFVRKDKLNHIVREIPLEEGYVLSKFRESRNRDGTLTYMTGDRRLELIKGMPVYNVNSERMEVI